MNERIAFILIFLFGTQVVLSQVDSIPNNWDKIVIGDSYGGWSHFDNKFQIKKEDFLLTTLNKPDSIIKKIDSKLIFELINLMNRNNDSVRQKRPLSFFGKDSLWLEQNAETLWREYTKKRKTTREIDSIAINTIKDNKKANRVAWSLQGSHWTDDYPIVYIHLINKKDTLSAYSNGQYPFMLPWNIKGHKVYDSKIS